MLNIEKFCGSHENRKESLIALFGFFFFLVGVKLFVLWTHWFTLGSNGVLNGQIRDEA